MCSRERKTREEEQDQRHLCVLTDDDRRFTFFAVVRSPLFTEVTDVHVAVCRSPDTAIGPSGLNSVLQFASVLAGSLTTRLTDSVEEWGVAACPKLGQATTLDCLFVFSITVSRHLRLTFRQPFNAGNARVVECDPCGFSFWDNRTALAYTNWTMDCSVDSEENTREGSTLLRDAV